MRKWIVRLAVAAIVGLIRQHGLLWPLAASLARGLTLDEILRQLAAMTSTELDDLLAQGSFREALRRAIDAYDGSDDYGAALFDSFLGRIEEAME